MAGTPTFEELKHMTVTQLREIATGLPEEAVKGHTQMNKEHLLRAVCHALKIDMHAHHEVVGINKADIKVQIRQLKKQRDEMIEAGKHENVHIIRRRIHHLKRELHKATV
jgi:glutamate mutase epsilon subunit